MKKVTKNLCCGRKSCWNKTGNGPGHPPRPRGRWAAVPPASFTSLAFTSHAAFFASCLGSKKEASPRSLFRSPPSNSMEVVHVPQNSCPDIVACPANARPCAGGEPALCGGLRPAARPKRGAALLSACQWARIAAPDHAGRRGCGCHPVRAHAAGRAACADAGRAVLCRAAGRGRVSPDPYL